MKIYTVDKPMLEWITEHREEMYREVLLQCEDKLLYYDGDTYVNIALLKTDAGITKFVIKNYDGIIESLERAMFHFAEMEHYELAARARDCINGWKENE